MPAKDEASRWPTTLTPTERVIRCNYCEDGWEHRLPRAGNALVTINRLRGALRNHLRAEHPNLLAR